MNLKYKIKLIILDISGTIIDHGSLVTVNTFIKVFNKFDIKINPELIIKDMGIRKEIHIKKILNESEVKIQIKNKFKTNKLSKNIYNKICSIFDKELRLQVKKSLSYIVGFNDLLKFAKKNQIMIGLTTGYPRPVLNTILEHFKKRKFIPDYAVSATDVKRGRPYGDMSLKIIKNLKVHKKNAIKVDDSISGIKEGINAGIKTVGVSLSGIHFLNSYKYRKTLSLKKVKIIHKNISKSFLKAKATYVIKDISFLKKLLIKKSII
tara:strand:- start:123 stop:914 length:792 start_codon:yes stop_codon:yes gene_type:complete